jgi:hypothetical protein
MGNFAHFCRMYISSLVSTSVSLKFSALKQTVEAVCKSERPEAMYARRQLFEKTAQLKLSAMRPVAG